MNPEREIKISPILQDSWFIANTDSFRFGIEEGCVYTPRFLSRDECDQIENGANFYKKQCLSVNHEFIHRILMELENIETSKSFDNISKDEQNEQT